MGKITWKGVRNFLYFIAFATTVLGIGFILLPFWNRHDIGAYSFRGLWCGVPLLAVAIWGWRCSTFLRSQDLDGMEAAIHERDGWRELSEPEMAALDEWSEKQDSKTCDPCRLQEESLGKITWNGIWGFVYFIAFVTSLLSFGFIIYSPASSLPGFRTYTFNGLWCGIPCLAVTIWAWRCSNFLESKNLGKMDAFKCRPDGWRKLSEPEMDALDEWHEKQGIEIRKERAVCHEAGHVVTALHLGFHVEKVAACEGRPNTVIDLDCPQRNDQERCIVLAGGIAGEKMCLPDDPYDQAGAARDRDEVSKRGGGDIDRYLQPASKIIQANKEAFYKLRKRMIQEVAGSAFEPDSFDLLSQSEIREIWTAHENKV